MCFMLWHQKCLDNVRTHTRGQRRHFHRLAASNPLAEEPNFLYSYVRYTVHQRTHTHSYKSKLIVNNVYGSTILFCMIV